MTSNPTIFEKALSTGDWYDDQLAEVLEREDDLKEVFIALAVEDVRDACDVLLPTWERTKRIDGRVSIEVDPDLAYDRSATYDEAMRLHALVDRPNAYVKIPATEPGLGAIEDCIAAGKPINVTLIFSLERYAEVVEAYVRGVERLVDRGGDPGRVDLGRELLRLAGRHRGRSPSDEAGRKDLCGKLAVANAKLAYVHYQETFASGAGRSSPPQGARVAAVPVGVHVDEEPEYSDVLYVDELIGPDT